MKHNDHEGELFMLDTSKIKDGQLDRDSRRDWVEETFIEYSEEEIYKSNKSYVGLALSGRRIFGFFFLIFVCIGILFARSAYLQIFQGEHYSGLAERNRIRIQYLPAPRGIFYDKNNEPLVKNVSTFSLYVTPFDFPKEQEAATVLTERLVEIFSDWEGEKSEQLAHVLKTASAKKEYFEPQEVVQNLAYETAMKLKILSSQMPGVSVGVSNVREYFNQNARSLSHILGYEGPISEKEFEHLEEEGYLFNERVGKTGLEFYYEEDLKGSSGRKQIEVDSLGKEKSIISKEDMLKGNDLILTIDKNIQIKLEQIVREYLIEQGKQRAVAIVMDPNNGEILALVNFPSYDNNLFAQGIEEQAYENLIMNSNKPLYNRAVSGEYPSGSTIKPVIAAAALEEGIINEKTSFLSVGRIRIDKWFFPDWKAGGHGVTNVYKALSESVNTFFYIIGGGHQKFVGLGVYKIKEYCELFGLNQMSGVDLPSEQLGFLPTPGWKESTKGERWYIGDTYHLSIGQGDLLVTPLQVANYTAVFANGGTLYEPHLVKKIFNEQTKFEKEINPKVIRQDFVSDKTIQAVRTGLRRAVTSGSAKRLNWLPVTSAGKTGTAQWGVDKDPHAWFTGFAPYADPQIVVTVLVEEGEEGSTIAVPIADDFLRWWAQY